MTDHIDRAAEVLTEAWEDRVTQGISDAPRGHCHAFADALADAGLLATPEHDRHVILNYLRTLHTPTVRIETPEQMAPFLAKHDAAVAAKALREAADEVYGDERAAGQHWHPLSAASWLRDRADRIETEGDDR